MIPPRSEAQIAASISNGAASNGPTTSEGKEISALNGVRQGLSARFLVLPGEDPNDFATNLESWNALLLPTSPVEAQLVAVAADLDWRLGRLTDVERRHVAAYLQVQVEESSAAKLLKTAEDARAGIAGLAALAEAQVGEGDGASVAKLLPLIDHVFGLARVVLSSAVVAPLANAIEAIVAATVVGKIHDEFTPLASACRDVEDGISKLLPELSAAVERERERLAGEVALGEGRELRKLERRRAALQRELNQQLGLLAKVRELAPSGSIGHAKTPFKVELRVVGGKK